MSTHVLQAQISDHSGTCSGSSFVSSPVSHALLLLHPHLPLLSCSFVARATHSQRLRSVPPQRQHLSLPPPPINFPVALWFGMGRLDCFTAMVAKSRLLAPNLRSMTLTVWSGNAHGGNAVARELVRKHLLALRWSNPNAVVRLAQVVGQGRPTVEYELCASPPRAITAAAVPACARPRIPRLLSPPAPPAPVPPPPHPRPPLARRERPAQVFRGGRAALTRGGGGQGHDGSARSRRR